MNFGDRVQETTETTGTGTISLQGPSDGFQTFVDGIGNGNSCTYLIKAGDDWEIGVGVVTSGSPNTLSRSVRFSSNGNALLNLGEGTHIIANVLDATTIAELIDDIGGLTTDVGSKAVVEFFTATIIGSGGVSDWSQATSADPWIATITVNGILSSDRPIVSLDVSLETFDNALFLQKVWNLVYRVEASANDQIKLYAAGEPYPDLNVLIKVVR